MAHPEKPLKIKPQTTSTIELEGQTLAIGVTLRDWTDKINYRGLDGVDTVKVEINCKGKSIKMKLTRVEEKHIEVD